MAKAISYGITLWVDDNSCRVCRRCAAQAVCHSRALMRIDQDEPPFVDVHRCQGCKICMDRCPANAIILR